MQRKRADALVRFRRVGSVDVLKVRVRERERVSARAVDVPPAVRIYMIVSIPLVNERTSSIVSIIHGSK